MKRIIICVLLIIGIAGFSFAAGPPVQPVVNVKGCWSADLILSFAGGNSAPSGNPQPFYTYPARKMVGHTYLRIDNQSGGVISGKWYSFLGPICSDSPTCGRFIEYPIEGYISGNIISLSSSVEDGYAHNEEHRYLSALISYDSNGIVLRGTGLVSRNYSEASGPYAWSNLTFQFWMRPYTAGTCNAEAFSLPLQPMFGNVTCGFQCPPLP